MAFIDFSITHQVSEVLEISFVLFSKPKPIREFDGRPAYDITYAIYPTLTMQDNMEILAQFFVTILGQHLLILEKP